MAELMTVESIIEAYYQLFGFFTKVRMPVKVEKNYSDIDVLAFHADNKQLVFCESKAHGSKTSAREILIKKPGDLGKPHERDLLHFIDNALLVLKPEFDLKIDFKQVKKIILHFVNVHKFILSENVSKHLQKKVTGSLRNRGYGTIHVEIKVQTHFELLMEIVAEIRNDKQGRRYGHPILDVVRELNRHTLTTNKRLQKDNKAALKKAFDIE